MSVITFTPDNDLFVLVDTHCSFSYIYL
jgi:hypothetical protein